MIFPTRPIRKCEFAFGHNYYDDENIVQEDGRIAHFSISKETEKDGWKFEYYIDKYGFMIWDNKFFNSEHGQAFAKQLLTSIVSHDNYMVREQLRKDFEVGKDEMLFRYSYGGVMSKRGGWFVINTNTYAIVRSIQTIMS